MFIRLIKLLAIISCFLIMTGTISNVFANNGHDDEINGNFAEALPKGLNDFPIKTTLDINPKETYSVIKKNGSRYNINKTKIENGIISYDVHLTPRGETFFITVSEKDNKIISFEYYLFDVNDQIVDDYYENLLPIIAGKYGNPTKTESIEYKNKNYKCAQFYEKNNYEYYFGLTSDLVATDFPTTRCINFKVKAL